MTLDVQVNFVIPNGCEQDECSEEMHQAYITCEQHRGGGLNACWIREDDCMRLQNVTKKDVFVLEEFDGAVFEKLKSSKCLLVGPRCLSCCLMEGVPIPSGPEPVFTVAMRGLVVTASGLTKSQKDKIKERVHWMGGLYRNQLTNDTTHLISSTVLSDKYIKSVELGIPIMSITWVTDVWDTSLSMNINGNSAEFNKHRLKPFTNLHITTSGIGKKEKQSIIKLVSENGGTFTGAFQSESTDIVIMTKEGVGSEKYKAAIEFGKACLHPLWVQHSVEKGFAQPIGKYKIAGASTSSPLAHHNLPDISLNFSRITSSRPTSNVVDETTDNSVITSCRTKLSQEVRKSNDSPLVDKDIMIAFDKFDMNSVKKAGPVFDGFFVWVVGGSGLCRERACGLVSRGGGVRYDCPGPRVTHIVAMSAGAAAKAAAELPNVPVVSAIWLIKCVEAEKALDITEYLMNEGAAKSSCGSVRKSRLEPPSPLSKKNLQMLRPPCPPPPVFEDNNIDNAQDDILQQYKNQTSATSSKSNVSSEPRPEVTRTAEDEPTEELEQIFEGVKFEVQSLDEETLCELGAEVTATGGVLLPAGGGGSHALVPLDFDINELVNKNAEPVTVFWVRDCLTQQELVPIQYYHKPVRVINATALQDVVISLSTYSGVERAFLDELATLLGATTQLRFCRRAAADALASTHLLCPEPTGEKYAGAVRWGLPAVTAHWLLECAALGKRLHEQPYLVGDTKAPPLPISEESKETTLEIENVVTIEKRKSVTGSAGPRDSSKERTPRVKQKDVVQGGVNTDADMSPASRYIAMARQGLLNADSQETPKRMKDVQQEQVTEGAIRTPPLDEALSTPNLAALSPTTRRRIQAVRRGEMPSDPIRTPKNPFEDGPGTPDSAFGAALRPGSGLSPGSRKRLWRQVQHLPGKQLSPAVNKQTPLSEIRNRFLAQFSDGGAPTPPTDHGPHGPRKLHLPDQADTPPAKIPKIADKQSPSVAIDAQHVSTHMENEKTVDKSTSNSEGVDSQLRRLSAALTGGDATPSHLRLRRQKDSTDSLEAIAMVVGAETEEPPSSQANTVRWDDGPASLPSEAAGAAEAVPPAPELDPVPSVKRFMLSNNVDNQQDLSDMIVSLGGEVCSGNELDPSATHLLCAAPVRSEKMLGAVAAGKWALHPAYVARSRLHGAFLPEEEYEWGNPRATSLPSLSVLEQAVARAAHRWRTARAAGRPGAFAGLRALLHMPPARRRLLTKLLKAGDGDVVDDAPPYSAEDVTLCLADFKRYPISDRDAQWLRDRRIPVCPYILLFSYLTEEQQPDPKQHCLPEFQLNNND